jgi:N-acyl-D-aspartate/D-glutamate deacylase
MTGSRSRTARRAATPAAAAGVAVAAVLAGLVPLPTALTAERYDVVVRGGRVMDPESGLDAVRDIGIRDGRIARISEASLDGGRVLDARGLVVAPGFIDLHQHGQSGENDRLKIQDGVTTALELEIGVSDVARFLQERAGKALLNFGTAASHPAARVATLGAPIAAGAVLPLAGPATDRPVTAEEQATISGRLRAELDAGGLGVGMGINYVPGATRLEVIEAFRVAAERRRPVFVHVRSAGQIEPGSSVESVGEVIAAAAVTGAPLHIVHINSVGLKDVAECLRMVEGARARGLDVTAEGYPYIAGMTAVNSALFNPGWREKLGLDYKDLQDVQTGERLTEASFARLRAQKEERTVLLFQNTDERVDSVIRHPLVMIASDGYMKDGKGHPRTAGTYARILRRYVREQRSLTLMEALRKMSLMPAQRLEAATPAGRTKGRVQEGADADLVAFDPATVSDRATWEKPAEPSVGMRFVLVGGTPVVDAGALVPNVFPGRALVGGR